MYSIWRGCPKKSGFHRGRNWALVSDCNIRKLSQPSRNEESVFANAHANIKKGQKRQKKNCDLSNERSVWIDVGDVVLKEKQKDISCKGGKLHDRYNASTYTVVKVMQNGNALLHSNKPNEVLATPCPLKHLKKYVKRAVRNADYKYEYKCNKDDYWWDAK